MAFDYGGKRTGIAVTDPLKMIANALTTVHSKDVIVFLKEYTQNEDVELFVVGEPKQMDNTPSQSAAIVEAFVKELKKQFTQIPIVRVDERFTSKMASRIIAQSGKTKKERQKKELIDSISATILLQSYMESINYQK